MYCDGSGAVLGNSCIWCEGTGELVDHIQDSFEQHGPPEKKPKFKVDFKGVDTGIPKVGLDSTGWWMIDKNGKKIMMGETLSTGITPTEEEKEVTIDVSGFTAELDLVINTAEAMAKNPFDGVIGDIVKETVAKIERIAMRHLMIWEVDKLLDLYNDYKDLHTAFGDKEYSDYMKEILKVLKAKTSHRTS